MPLVARQDKGVFALQTLGLVDRADCSVRGNRARKTAPPMNLLHGLIGISELAEPDCITELAAIIKCDIFEAGGSVIHQFGKSTQAFRYADMVGLF